MTIKANNLPISITDLALRPSSNTLYGTSLSEDDFTNSIYTINPTTGVATLIGNTGVIGATIAFGPDGTLYQTSASSTRRVRLAGYLNTLDPDTGAVLTTSAPFTSEHVGGLAVRPTDGVIFASGGDAGRLWPSRRPAHRSFWVSRMSVGWATSRSHRCRLAMINARMADGRGSDSLTALRTRAIASSSLTQANSRVRHARGNRKRPI